MPLASIEKIEEQVQLEKVRCDLPRDQLVPRVCEEIIPTLVAPHVSQASTKKLIDS
jgi:hypothetical protein